MTTLTGDYLELRPLAETDISALWKVYQGTPLYFDGLGDDAARLTEADVRAQWQAAQTQPQRTLFGVYHIETALLIGAAEVQIGTPEAGAAALWLLIWGGFQRQGYGQECLALLEQWLSVEQRGAALYAVATHNEEGQSFLRLQGFRATGARTAPLIGRGAAFWMKRDSQEHHG